jgi:hypothetical protein
MDRGFFPTFQYSYIPVFQTDYGYKNYNFSNHHWNLVIILDTNYPG